MKRKLLLLLLAGLTVGVAMLVRARRADAGRYHDSLAEAEARFAKEKEELARALADARNRPPEVVTNTVTLQAPLPAPPTAAEILQKLIELKTGGGFADIRAQRQAVVYFEALVGLGAKSLPTLRAYLLRFEDADYTPDARRTVTLPESVSGENNGLRRRWWQQLAFGERQLGESQLSKTSLDFGVPPTLRLGLFDVLHAIGGETSEAILLEQLQRTGRALEVAYLAHTLRDMSGETYRTEILQTTHELLLAAPQPQTGAVVDKRAKDYLYAVLEMFADPTFTGSAVQLLVGSDGQMDHHALDYLGRTLRENIVPVLAFVWSNPSLTNVWDRGALAGIALPHLSTNQQANQLVRASILETSLPRELRSKMLRALEEPLPPSPGSNPEAILMARVQLVSGLFGELQDEELVQEAAALRQRLIRQLTDGSLMPQGKSTPEP